MKFKAVTENHLYKKAYSKGEKFCGKYVAVYILRDLSADKIKNARPDKKYVNRIGISTSKKIGGAVVRSRVRRIIREGYREVERNVCLHQGKLVIIAARSAAAGAKSTDIARELLYAMKRVNMVKKDPAS